MHATDDRYRVLVDGEGRHALWPEGLTVPAGWRVAQEAADRAEALAHVEQHWADIRPQGSAPGPSLYELFAAQAARTPEAPALIRDEERISYRELEAHATRIAALVGARGAGRGAYIGLCVERGPQMIAAVLGILRAGAAYVPLDPDYPVGRLRYVLADTGARLLLTQTALTGLFPDYDGEVLALDAVAQESAAPAAESAAGAGSDAAYVIHTSGSTGKPKGILVSHASLANHSAAVNEHFALGPGDRVLQCRSLSFDAAAEEIFPPLLHGAALVLTGDPLRQTFRALTQQIIDTGTTFLSIPTAFWHSWIREEDTLIRLREESRLRMLMVAGEKANRSALDTWSKWVEGRIEWRNVYGPTEGTITTTVYAPEADESGAVRESVPIGRPISGVQTHVLDEALQPVAPGETGELCIGGAGVALGYLHQPALTAERFLPDPFSAAGGRLYRTGDLVRADADGCLEFLGRRDHQVKLRGYRIELPEVELALAAHPDIAEAVAAVDETDPENKVLAVFATTRPGAAPATAELMGHLRQELPWYMIPGAIRTVDAFPLTPNGKIDRQALLALAAEQADEAATFLAPRTATETALVAIWQDVLEADRISIDADFFQSGGHSLLAATLLSRIRKEFGLRIPARALFEAPTVAGLAAAVDTKRAEAEAAADA